jgi:hypothetical protein
MKLDGYKTYVMALGAAVVVFAHALNWIDEATFQTLLALFGAGGLAALRAGVTKSGPTQ